MDWKDAGRPGRGVMRGAMVGGGVKRERDGWMTEPGPAGKRINESLKVE